MCCSLSSGECLFFSSLETPIIWPYHLSPPMRTGAYFPILERFDQLVWSKKLKRLTTGRVFRTGTRCQLMDKRPRSATSCLGDNLSSSFSFVSAPIDKRLCIHCNWLMLHMQTPQSSNKWIFVVCHRRKNFFPLSV